MRVCTACQQAKDESDFYWQNIKMGKRATKCIPCTKIVRKASWASGSEREKNYAAKARRVQAAQDFLWSVLSLSSCVDCGEDDPLTLEFDHVSGVKKNDVSNMVSQNYGVDAIRSELEKCEIVCANCHRVRTATRANSWRVQRLTATR